MAKVKTQSKADRTQAAIEEMLRAAAPTCHQLQRIIAIRTLCLLDLVFLVHEPLYEAEKEVLPLIRHAYSLVDSLMLDFVVLLVDEGAYMASEPGARVIYELSG